MSALNEAQLHSNSGTKVSCCLQAYWCRVQDYLKLNGPTELERAGEGGFEHCTTNSACKAANLTEAQNLPQEQQQQVDTGNNENKGKGEYPNGTRNARHNHGHGGAQTARRASCDASGLDNGTLPEVC